VIVLPGTWFHAQDIRGGKAYSKLNKFKNSLTRQKLGSILILNTFKTSAMSSLLLTRTAIASVWLYQGLWCKIFGRVPHHEAIVGGVPFLSAAQARRVLLALGSLECVLAAWVVSGIYAREAALTQTLLLVSMNAAGLIWARRMIPDPVGMLLQNFVFLLLAWVAAGEFGPYAGIG
jgi:hypothetical protein